jgi:isoamylase
MGASFTGDGVNFAVFSAHAEKIELCLFTSDGRKETARLPILDRDGDIWHIHVGGLTPGTVYGFRAHGPYAPEQGHRFNPHKLLLDPYARALEGRLKWSDAVMGYKIGSPRGDLSFDTRDSAFAVPKAVVSDPSFSWGTDQAPRTPRSDSVIYEAHVKAMTMLHPGVERKLRGSYLGLCSDAVIDHLQHLGVTAIELLPVQAFIDDRFLVAKGLRNHWGYNTLAFFAPEVRYMSQGALWEFQTMVRRFHSAGIEVILDVVYNHTAEGDEWGPTLSYRGLDNASYYRLAGGGRHYVNDTGTGNTLNLTHPMVLRMVMDSLRYWVEVGHVDGFRFDLATVLGREAHGFDPNGGFFDAIRQDPVLSRVKLIAEPWDVGPGGYQLGAFPPPFSEWNDKYRDQVRRYWRGDPDTTRKIATRLSGSAIKFDHDDRPATASVNFLTAHDGFTLMDVVSYNAKHNEANGENNQDGHSENYSDNMGVEGPTTDKAIIAARAQRRRNMMATLLLSQGTPMILAGDELGNSQGGNNNAYCQDNAIGWVDWGPENQGSDPDFLRFVQQLIAFRRQHPILRQSRFLHARNRATDGKEDLFWRHSSGEAMTDADWANPALRHVAVEMRTASGTPEYAVLEYAIFAVFNVGESIQVTLPAPPAGQRWVRHIDTASPHAAPKAARGRTQIRANSVVVLVLEPDPAHPA